MSKLRMLRIWLARKIIPADFPMGGSIIVPLGGKFEVWAVQFHDVQITLQDGSNSKIEGCYFDMPGLSALGRDFVTIRAEIPFDREYRDAQEVGKDV